MSATVTRFHELSPRPYPVSIGLLSERHIEVTAEDEQLALATLESARRDGLLEAD